MRNLIFTLVVLSFLGGMTEARAKALPKVVLMPVVSTFTKEQNSQIAESVAKGLSSRYQVVFGSEVEAEVAKTVAEEKKGPACDADVCFKKVAKHFGADNVATLVVALGGGGKSVSITMSNVAENKVVFQKLAFSKNSSFDEVLKTGSTLSKSAK